MPGATAAVSGAGAVVLSYHLFPYRSGDHDEAVYLTQADALAHGHLTLPAERAPLFQPTLTGIAHGRLVFPFPTAWSAVLTVARAAGSTRVALMLTAIAAVLAVAFFAREALDDTTARHVAVVAFAASPFVWMLSATYLPYVFDTALVALAGAFTLRALRTAARRDIAATGFVVACTFALRPFDGLLVAVVIATYAAVVTRGATSRARLAAWACVGGAAPAAITLAINRAVTGGLLRFPLSATGGANSFFFGDRRVDAIGATVHYGMRDAFFALKQNLWFFPTWVLGSWLLVAAAAVTVWSRRTDPRTWLLAGLAVVWPAGYVFWWATKLTAPGARDGLGPHYYVPAVASLVILGAPTIAAVLRRGRAIAFGTVVALLAATIVFVPGKIRDKLDGRDAEAPALAAALRAPQGSVVVLDDSDRIGDHHPTLLDPYDLDAPVIYATHSTPAQLQSLRVRFRDRRFYVLAMRDGSWQLTALDR